MKSSDGSNRPLIRRPTRTLLVVVPLLAIAGVIASGAVHEGGHAIVARLAGLEVVNTQPWVLLGPPHVQVRGETTNAWRAAMNSAGMLASVGTGLAGTGTLLWAARWRPRCLLGTWFFAPMICQCLAWIIVPVVIAFGGRAPRDDVAKFIRNTGWRPTSVALLSALLAALAALVALSVYRRWRLNGGTPTRHQMTP